MSRYKVERSNVSYYGDRKSMNCTFTITHLQTQEKHVFKNIYLAQENREAFLVFPFTNEEVYINREKETSK